MKRHSKYFLKRLIYCADRLTKHSASSWSGNVASIKSCIIQVLSSVASLKCFASQVAPVKCCSNQVVLRQPSVASVQWYTSKMLRHSNVASVKCFTSQVAPIQCCSSQVLRQSRVSPVELRQFSVSLVKCSVGQVYNGNQDGERDRDSCVSLCCDADTLIMLQRKPQARTSSSTI